MDPVLTSKTNAQSSAPAASTAKFPPQVSEITDTGGAWSPVNATTSSTRWMAPPRVLCAPVLPIRMLNDEPVDPSDWSTPVRRYVPGAREYVRETTAPVDAGPCGCGPLVQLTQSAGQRVGSDRLRLARFEIRNVISRYGSVEVGPVGDSRHAISVAMAIARRISRMRSHGTLPRSRERGYQIAWIAT